MYILFCTIICQVLCQVLEKGKTKGAMGTGLGILLLILKSIGIREKKYQIVLCFGKKNKSGKMAWNKGQALI
jgi:hypothetical protein